MACLGGEGKGLTRAYRVAQLDHGHATCGKSISDCWPFEGVTHGVLDAVQTWTCHFSTGGTCSHTEGNHGRPMKQGNGGIIYISTALKRWCTADCSDHACSTADSRSRHTVGSQGLPFSLFPPNPQTKEPNPHMCAVTTCSECLGMIILKSMKFSCLSIACQVPHAMLIFECQTLSLSNASIEKQRPWRVADILRYGVSALLVRFRLNNDNEPVAHPTPDGVCQHSAIISGRDLWSHARGLLQNGAGLYKQVACP